MVAMRSLAALACCAHLCLRSLAHKARARARRTSSQLMDFCALALGPDPDSRAHPIGAAVATASARPTKKVKALRPHEPSPSLCLFHLHTRAPYAPSTSSHLRLSLRLASAGWRASVRDAALALCADYRRYSAVLKRSLS